MSVTDLTEEMLLDSPTDETEGTLMDVNARGPEKPLDPKVSSAKKLSRAFGTTDPIRNEVGDIVTAQTKVSLELISNAADELLSQVSLALRSGSDVLDCEVVEILRVANLTTVPQLEACLDEKIRDREIVAQLSEKVSCSEAELLSKIEEMERSDRVVEKDPRAGKNPRWKRLERR
ncbi:hypothetical protein Q1695_003589 [Nippostrongylus brasiliensis]|nr:hypothetical protein Q1695_003589 [Nippostrongylus brasiliensis]